jgi:GAF domain-containing protein
MEAGFQAAHALPMRLRGSVIGALNLFSRDEGPLPDDSVAAGQALAAVATIAILQQRVVADAQLLNAQLNAALTSRVVIEQAKGVLAERSGLSMQAAFEAMRQYSRNNNLRLADVAGHVIDKSLPPGAIDAGRKRPKPPNPFP